MSNVTLSIGGRAFTLACRDGEETHVTRLGRLIDAKVATAGVATHSEARMLLFAALLLADEVHELHGSAKVPGGLAERLEKIAGRIENLADLLESASPSD